MDNNPDLLSTVRQQQSAIEQLTKTVKDLTSVIADDKRRARVWPANTKGFDTHLMVYRGACWLKSLVLLRSSLLDVQYVLLFDTASPMAEGARPDLPIYIDAGSIESLDYADGLFFSKGLYIAQSISIDSLLRVPLGIETKNTWIHANYAID